MARTTAALSHTAIFLIGLSLCIRKIGVDLLQLLHYTTRALAVIIGAGIRLSGCVKKYSGFVRIRVKDKDRSGFLKVSVGRRGIICQEKTPRGRPANADTGRQAGL
jgi:hypothetical protein